MFVNCKTTFLWLMVTCFQNYKKTPSAHLSSFFITSVRFLYIIHRFTPFLHYKIRIIFHICKIEEGKKEVRVECNVCLFFNLLFNQAKWLFLYAHASPWHTGVIQPISSWRESLEKKKRRRKKQQYLGKKSTALIKFVLFSSFCRCTYSLALIKIILLSSYCRITHHFPTTLILRENKINRLVVVQAHITNKKIKRKKTMREKKRKKAGNKINYTCLLINQSIILNMSIFHKYSYICTE